jgi:hypothetical protein
MKIYVLLSFRALKAGKDKNYFTLINKKNWIAVSLCAFLIRIIPFLLIRTI